MAVLVGIVLLGIIGFGVYYFVFLRPGATINITANQTGIDLNFDGKELKGITTPYQIKLGKGNYTITAKKEGFVDLTKTLEITSLTKTYTVSFDLIAQPEAQKIISNEVFFPAYFKDTNSLLYFTKGETGYSLKEFNLSTQEETTQIELVGEVVKIAWSPTYRQLAIKVVNSGKVASTFLPYLSQYGEGTKINWIVNLERKELINITKKDLHPSIKNISFNPEGSKITYLFQNDTTRALGVANYDGSAFERLMDFQTLKFEPDPIWSTDGGRIAIVANQEMDAASNAEAIDVYTYNFASKDVTRISEDGVSYGALFSPDGLKMAFNSGKNLMVYDFSNGSTKAQNLEIESYLTNTGWLDNQTLVTLTNDKTIYKLKLGSPKQVLGYKKASIGVIKSIIVGSDSIYFFGTDGVYELSLEGNI